jgi:hypothetical protein
MLVILASLLLASQLSGCAAGYDGTWNVAEEILRLRREVPSLGAFKGVSGLVWLSSYDYLLRPDGTMQKTRRYLVMLSDEGDAEGADSMVLPHPSGRGATLGILEAAWYDPETGERGGDLPSVVLGGDGVSATEVRFPPEARGRIAAIETAEEIPRRFFLDDVLPMAGDLPVWEQTVRVELPEGMSLYWEGAGIREPLRHKEGGVERVVWTVMNQPVWRSTGVLQEIRPTLIFSLQRGIMNGLKALSAPGGSFRIPPVPASVASGRSNLTKVGANLAEYLSARRLVLGGYEPVEVRDGSNIPPDGPWTTGERALIAEKWLQSLGWDARAYWSQKLPVGPDGPSSSSLWEQPVLRILQDGGRESFFCPGGTPDFGKLQPSLYGSVVYRVDGADLERPVLPWGSASDHTLTQMWRLGLDDMGIATGTLDLTVTGAWVGVMLGGADAGADGMAEAIAGNMEFGVPGLSMTPSSFRRAGSGYRFSFDVRAQLGIVSGNDMLMRLPGGRPRGFDGIPEGSGAFSFEFPFVFEQSAVISTPPGYRALMLPSDVQNGDSKAMLTESIVHWTKSRRVEASAVWTVRSASVEESASGRVRGQLDLAVKWPETTIPLRK